MTPLPVMKTSPKVVIVGAGSLFFGRKAIWQMVHSSHLCTGTLALVDTHPGHLDKMKRLAEKVIAHNRSPLKLEASTNRREVLTDADFVVLCFAADNARYRGIDCEVSARFGIRMCSGDTIGPGGLFRAMRELPEILRAARDIQELAPEAWVINYINPTTVMGMALRRHAPELKSLALCDAQWNLREVSLKLAGVLEGKEPLTAEVDKDLVLLSSGVNHFTWLLRAEYKGRDLIPAIAAGIARNAERELNPDENDPAYTGAKGHLNSAIQHELYEAFGAIPTVVAHTKEYVRFYQGHHTQPPRIPPLMLFDARARTQWTDSVWKRVDGYLGGDTPIAEFDTEFGPDPATDLIEGMWANLGKKFFINTANNGVVPNLADDAFIELYSDVDKNGPRPLPCPPLPRGIRGLTEQVLDAHELSVEAIVTRDRSLLRRALLTDPLTPSIADADGVIEALLAAEKEQLPDWH